jgi:hypothetical protein
MTSHTITFVHGTARCLWTEAVPLYELGVLDIQRAIRVEFQPSTLLWEVHLASDPDSGRGVSKVMTGPFFALGAFWQGADQFGHRRRNKSGGWHLGVLWR